MPSLCNWLTDAAGVRWEVQWPAGYQAAEQGSTVVLLGPDGDVALRPGDRVGVNGEADPPDLGSWCMMADHLFVASEIVFIER